MFIIPEEIVSALSQNKLVIFVGSGFSKQLGFLDWNGLAFKAITEYKAQNANIELLKECLTKNLLSEILIFDALRDLDKHKIIEIIKNSNNLSIDIRKLENHKRLWKISSRIITTNYDKTIEAVKPNASVEVISHNHLFELGKSLKKDAWLFHIHGMVDNTGECVIFSEDYHRLYNGKHPAIEQLKSIALHNTILFLGFSLKDKYVAKLFEDLNIIFSDTPSTEHFILLKESEILINRHVKKLPILDYSETSEFLDNLIAIKEAALQSPVPIKGSYLRRRCRTFYPGSDDFNKIMIELRGVELLNEELAQFEQRINKLVGYEKVLATCALTENSGDVETMIQLLSESSFEGNQENTRLLFLALGYEKLNKIKSAIATIDKIINKPDLDAEMSICAKFNRCICAEKIENYEEVYFKQFISNNTTLKFTTERIRDKAISNHLIECTKRNIPFLYEEEFKESTEYEIANGEKALSKSLINYYTYKNELIDKNIYDEILSLGKSMNTNSRVTVLCKLCVLMDKDTLNLLKDEILNVVENLCKLSPSYTNKKHFENLKRHIDEQN